MIVVLLCVIMHSFLVKWTWHPALQSVGTDMSECNANFGMMCARLAAMGSCGRSRRQVCVLLTLLPSGSVMDIGVVVGVMLVAGACVVR